ncbi:hypothetical protein M9458_045467, partial [Cirrhinus mrigala]
SPGVRPGTEASFPLLSTRTHMPLCFVRRLLSYWRRTQSSLQGFTPLTSSCPKKSGGLRPILDLQALNWSLLRLPFKMLMTKRMLLPCLRPFRWFAYKVLPFGLRGGCPVPPKSWLTGIRILNYLDDWLLIAHSRDLLCEQRDLVLWHLSHLGLQVNREKSKLSPL